jgi:hypothetical protein
MPGNPAFAFDRRFAETQNLEIGSESGDSFCCQRVGVTFTGNDLEFVDLIQDHDFDSPKSQWRSGSASDKSGNASQECFSPDVICTAG